MNFPAALSHLETSPSPLNLDRHYHSERAVRRNGGFDGLSVEDSVSALSKSMSESTPARRSKSIPICSANNNNSDDNSSFHRTPSEVQLMENEALADYRDYCMYARIVNGMAASSSTSPSVVANIVRTRHTPIQEEPDFFVNDDTDDWRREQQQQQQQQAAAERRRRGGRRHYHYHTSRSPVSTVGALETTDRGDNDDKLLRAATRTSWPVYQPPPFSNLPYETEQQQSFGERPCSTENLNVDEDIFVMDL